MTIAKKNLAEGCSKLASELVEVEPFKGQKGSSPECGKEVAHLKAHLVFTQHGWSEEK